MKTLLHKIPLNLRIITAVVALLLLVLLVWLLARPTVEETSRANDRFGLCFISAPDHLAGEARYQGALEAGAAWDRWPLYWHWVAEGGYVGAHSGGVHDYDTLISQEIAHHLTPVVILLGTPPQQTKAGAKVDTAEVAGENDSSAKPNSLPVAASPATLPPASLFEPIFVDGSNNPGPGKTINPANAWATFVYTTVIRYRPQGILAQERGWPRETGVRHWEIWNEPDYHLFWGGSVEEYYRLLEVAYKSIKAADPQATVILGGLAFYEQREWFPALLRQAEGDPARAYFDVFSFHHYLSVYKSEQLIRQARTTLDTYGLTQTPIWITESGVSVWDDYPATTHHVAPDTPFRATMTEQAAYVIQNSALAFYNGVERYYHFMLHDDCGDGPGSAYGLRQNFSPHACNSAEGKLRPAYAAYQLAAEHFRDLTPLWREKQYEQDQLAFYRPTDNSRLIVLWATQGLTATVTVSATGESAQLYWIEPAQTVSGTTGLSRTLTLTPTGGFYTLTLAPATNQNGEQSNDPTFQIGGPPFILVEQDTRSPQTGIQPLPPSTPPTFLVQWQGEDRGSGIAGYDVYVSENNQPLKLWLGDTVQTEAKYTGQVNHTYGFAVRARDRAGNEEPAPAQAQVTTQIISGPAVAGVVLGPGAEPVANATVSLTGSNIQEILTTNQAGQWPPVPIIPGDYTLEVHAPGYGTWPASRLISLTDQPAVVTTTLAPLANILIAGDFEGDQVWNVWEWQGQVNLSIDAFDGQGAARLGDGTGEPASCPGGKSGQLWGLSQQLTLPAEGDLLLSFLYKISGSSSPNTQASLELSLNVDDQSHKLVSPGELIQTDWTLTSLDLSPWQGQTAKIHFQVMHCGGQPFLVSVDRVSVGPKVGP